MPALMHGCRRLLLCVFTAYALCATVAHAQPSGGDAASSKPADKSADKAAEKTSNPSPTGEWHTYGDGGDKPRAVVRITEAGGVYTGRIMRSLVPGEDPDKICTKCADERKDKRLNGMAFLTGMRKVEGSQSGEYGGGEILDPDTGNVYRSAMTLSADGRRLTVRGYIGIPLFGRTQEWQRAGN